MKQAIICAILFVIIVTVFGELLLNRQSNTLSTASFLVILTISFYFLIFKPLKKLLP